MPRKEAPPSKCPKGYLTFGVHCRPCDLVTRDPATGEILSSPKGCHHNKTNFGLETDLYRKKGIIETDGRDRSGSV